MALRFSKFSGNIWGPFSNIFVTFPGSSPRVPKKTPENDTFEIERARDKNARFAGVVFLCENFPNIFGPLAKSPKMTPKNPKSTPKMFSMSFIMVKYDEKSLDEVTHYYNCRKFSENSTAERKASF